MKKILLLLSFTILIPVPSPSTAQDCSGPDGDIGVLTFNIDYGVLQICTAKNWVPVHSMTCPDGDGSSDPCSFEGSCSTPSPGTECADGSFYIGDSPADGTPVFMTSAAHETGSRWDEDPPCSRCGLGDTGATSITDGRANVEALRAYGGDNATAGNLDGFGAAKYCDNLTNVHGHDDWYLPAGGPNGSSSEINLIWLMVEAEGEAGGINTAGSWYWSSHEQTSTIGNARYQRFSDGTQNLDGKNSPNLVRCVRR